jgi:hypothetical protein
MKAFRGGLRALRVLTPIRRRRQMVASPNGESANHSAQQMIGLAGLHKSQGLLAPGPSGRFISSVACTSIRPPSVGEAICLVSGQRRPDYARILVGDDHGGAVRSAALPKLITHWLNRSVSPTAVRTTALAKHGKPEIFNTDQGSPFTSTEFIKVLAAREIKISMPLGDCLQSPAGNRWQGRLARHRRRRASVADHQIRRSLPAGLCQRVRSPRRDRPVSELLQQPPPAFIA